jgi:hypothetical protein
LFVIFSAVVNNKIMVGFSTRINDEKKVMFYDPISDLWNKGAHSSSTYRSATGVPTGRYAPQRVDVMGFIDAMFSNTSLSNQIYDPISDTWSIGKAMPTYRNSFGIEAVVDDVLYIIGGSSHGDEPTAVNEQYVPVGYHGTLPSTSEPFKPFLILALLILTFSIAAGYLTLYSKKKQKIV